MQDECSNLIWLGDKLPTIYDVAVHIFYLASTPTAEKREDAIHQYPSSLHELWVCSFGAEYVKPIKTISRIFSGVMAEYDKYRKTLLYGNVKRGIPSKTVRRVNKDWLTYCIKNSDQLMRTQERKGRRSKIKSAETDQPNDEVLNESGLLDIVCNTSKLSGPERTFYEDQKGKRKFRVSAEIDEEYEEEQQKQFELQLVCQEKDLINESYSNPIDFTEELPSSSTPGRTERYNKRTLLLSTSLNQLEQIVCCFLGLESGRQGMCKKM